MTILVNLLLTVVLANTSIVVESTFMPRDRSERTLIKVKGLFTAFGQSKGSFGSSIGKRMFVLDAFHMRTG